MKNSVVPLLLFALCGAILQAQTPTGRPFVRASGDASVFAPPDQVKVDATVSTQGKTAQEATAQNASRVAALLTALRQLLGTGADIKTINYFVGPNYQYPPGGGTPTLIGYTATNTVEVTLSDVSLAGPVIDTAAQNGATSVGGLRFALKDSQPSRLQALRLATLQARTHADAMASGLGGKVGAVISIQEGAQVGVPILTATAGDAGRTPPTSIEPGAIEVRASVVLEAELN
jgi:uncharacterized protein YggE